MKDILRARRLYLATTERVKFRIYSDNAEGVAKGLRVMEDYGFTLAEIRRAKRDRKAISKRYGELYSDGESALKAEMAAITEFSASLIGPHTPRRTEGR